MNPLRYICGVTTGTISVLAQRAESIIEGFTYTGRDAELVRVLRDNFSEFEGLDGLADAGIKSASDLPDFTFLGIDLSDTPTLVSIMVIIPILTFLASYFSMQLTRKMSYQAPTPDGADAGMSLKIMDFAMPALSTWISFMYPAVIGCYWIFQSVLSTLQQWILKKMYPFPEFTEEDYKKAEKELLGKQVKRPKPGANYDPNRPKVRSLHHIDDEDDDLPPPPPRSENPDDDDDDDSPAAGGNSRIGKADLK